MNGISPPAPRPALLYRAALLIPLGGLLTLAGYFGPWVDHPAAGLVVLGLDLGETVKFLPSVRSGSVNIWREGFYLPLVAVSLTFSLYSFRRELGYAPIVRVLLLAVAVVAALNLLPPAWTPSRLLTPEFRLQSVALVVCLAAAAFSPILALLPHPLSAALAIPLCVVAVWQPVAGFLTVLPEIRLLYARPLVPGWGPYLLIGGLVLMGVGVGFGKRG